MKRIRSNNLWQKARTLFPGGVNSPVRAFHSVGGTPVFMARGRGKYVYDADGNRYLDFLSSWGPLILGHAHRPVQKATAAALKKGSTFGTTTEREIELAEFIISRVPFIEKIRFVNSGTEAVMTALRLARGATGRSLVVKFEGCYHGHNDALLARAGSGLLTLSGDIAEASSPGIPEPIVRSTLVLPLDDESAFDKAMAIHGSHVACIIIEPLPANAGLLPQRKEFISHIVNKSHEHGALVIFDEVISGFRLGFSGYAGRERIYPDLVTYGKIIGGGLPVGAIAGKKELMDNLAPIGPVYQAGTLSGNPLAMTAGLAQMKELAQNSGRTYAQLKNLSLCLTESFSKHVAPLFAVKNWKIDLVQDESLFWFAFRKQADVGVVRNVNQIESFSKPIYANIFHALLNKGIYLAPSAYEVGFLNSAMKEKDIEWFCEELTEIIGKMPDQIDKINEIKH